ncbi:hypothetical protein FALCPG4_003081 [Fusarium falciforme]
MTKSSVDAVHGSSPSINGTRSEINRSQHDELRDGVATRSSLHLYDPTEPVNARLQNPLHVPKSCRDAVSQHPTAGAALNVAVPNTISDKELAGIGDQFSAD